MSFPTVDDIYAQGEGSTVYGMAHIAPYLYVLYYNCKIHKINTETYEKVGEWTAPSEAYGAGCMCTDCEYLYIGTSSPSPYRPIHVYKINPETMTTVTSWAGESYGNGQAFSRAIEFDFQSERLLVLEHGYLRGHYRIYKLKQDLTEELHVDADNTEYDQYNGWDLTIIGNHCFVTTGETPGAIDKRLISDLSFVARFDGYNYEPDDYIEGIFWNVCNDGEYIYTATYDYWEERPTRLIKVNPSDMSRVGTYYGTSDELLGMGSYAYGGKIYMLLYGWDGSSNYGEIVLQIDPSTMARTARYVNWAVDINIPHEAFGDGLKLHVGFGSSARSVLQFAESGRALCVPTSGIVALGDKVMLCPISNQYGDYIALKPDKAALTDKALIAPLNNQAALKLDFRNCKSKQGDKVICVPVSGAKKNILGLR